MTLQEAIEEAHKAIRNDLSGDGNGKNNSRKYYDAWAGVDDRFRGRKVDHTEIVMSPDGEIESIHEKGEFVID